MTVLQGHLAFKQAALGAFAEDAFVVLGVVVLEPEVIVIPGDRDVVTDKNFNRTMEGFGDATIDVRLKQAS